MTFFEIKIETLNHHPRGERVLKIPCKSSFNDLHLAIQIAFNLEMKEAFEFRKRGIIYKIDPSKPEECSSEESLEGLNEEERFTYCYDALLQQCFELTVLRCFEDEHSAIELLESDSKYWMEFPYLKGIQKTAYSSKWINEQLAGLNQDEQSLDIYKQRFNQAITRLSKVEYWQDYLHGLIVCIQFPMNHSVFIGAEVFKDKAILDFYFHQEAFLKYLMMDRNLAKKHLRKYQKQLQVCLSSLSKKKCNAKVIYQGSLWESFLYRGVLVSFIEAVEKFVKLIENLARFHQKDSTNPFYLIDTKENVYHELQLLRKQEVKEHLDISPCFQKGHRCQEVFEMDCFMGENSYELLCVGKDFCEKRNFSHFSRHGVIKEINDLLGELFKRVGICEILYVRDPWMKYLLQPICEQLEIELKMAYTLSELDESLKSREVDAGFVKLDFFDLLKGQATPLGLTNMKLN